MTAIVEVTTKDKTRQLILKTKGRTLSDEESRVLDQYLTFSTKLYIGLIDDEVCCAWGLVPPSLMSDQAYVWLFCTDLVERYKFVFIRRSQLAIKEMLDEYPVLNGFCEITNGRAIRWLRWLGAVFGEPVDPKYLPFRIRKK